MAALNISYLHGYWQRALGQPGAPAAEDDLDATLLSGLKIPVTSYEDARNGRREFDRAGRRDDLSDGESG